MKQQHHPIDLKTYEKGIKSDTNKEILGQSQEGEHIDALNMRSMSQDGDNFAKKKIKGEDLTYSNIDNRCFLTTPGTLSQAYICMMSQEVNNHIVEIWASPNPGEAPLMRIDGQVVLMSFDFPIDVNHPLQYHKNENCVSGEIYVTNNNTPPMVFSVKDLMDNSSMTPGGECTQKYFNDFNLSEYVIQTTGTLYKPLFVKQTSTIAPAAYSAVFGSAGLAVGSYSYSYRYVTQLGDRTPFAPITELIPVTRNNSSQFSPQYPYLRTFSSPPDITSSTAYGNHIRIKYQNDSDFQFIEVRRDSWYGGQPLDIPPVSDIIGSIPITSGLNIIDILDRAEPGFEGLTVLTLEEQTEQNSTIQRAKSIRYFNERLYLMNVGYAPKDLTGEVGFVDSVEPIFSTIQNLGTPGHKQVYNAAMYKSNMRGERVGFGVVLFDKNNNSSYVQKVPNADNYQFPNRRDEITPITQGTSYFGLVTAANTDGLVTETHEVFDHKDSVRRTEFTGTGDDGLVSLKENDPYHTLNPVSQNDTTTDYQYTINNKVGVSGTANQDYNPRGFGLEYYSQGAAFKGITTYPSDWAEGFSVVQTEPAKRVLAQGLGFYSMKEAEGIFGPDGSKDTNALWSYFPDLDLLYPNVYEDFINNPSAFSIQLVSPLGYFSEVYNWYNDVLDTRDKGVDLITYARILRDGVDPLNPAYSLFNPVISGGGNSGIPHTDGLDYVAYGRYTNYTSTDSPSFPSNANGNREFRVVAVNDQTTYSNLQNFLRVEIDNTQYGNIYNQTGPNGYPAVDIDANDQGVMEWREPMYVINLVKNVNVNPGITTQYNYSANYIKFKSLMLESSGAASQSARLVSERWEDCIPSINGEVYNAYSGLYRFVYVIGADGIERRWLNVSFESSTFISTLLSNMALNGFDTVVDASGSYDVYGIYTSTQTSDDFCPIFTLNFNEVAPYSQFTVPALGSKIYVYYDNRIPVRVFSGDTYINESVWSVFDNSYDSTGEPRDTAAEYKWNLPFPMKSYTTGPSYRRLQNTNPWNYSSTTEDMRFNQSGINGAYLRQLITMWTAETRINLSFAFNIEAPEKASVSQHFPLVNYIPRPYKWNTGNEGDRTVFENNNNLNPLYYDNYGFEWNLWGYGGFRFLPETNLDYSKRQTTTIYSSVPTVGFTEQTDYCTRVVWSEKRPVNVQDTPTVRTFPAGNFYDTSDDTGEIKFAWSALSSDKGNNLYAVTNSGICLLLVDKRVIHEINANELATVGSDIGGILNELWIDRTIGMSDETWRSWAEYSNALFFVNNTSSYAFADNNLTEIARSGFYELLRRKFLSIIGTEYSSALTGGYNILTKEYILNVDNGEEFSTMIYGIDQNALQCQSSYNYDKYLYFENKLFGMKDMKTFELGIGNQIDGQDMECYVSGMSDKEIYYDKEFIRIRVNSNHKPEQIYFYDSYQDYIVDNFSSFVDAVAVPLSIKDYYGYECYVPRRLATPHYRQQGRVLLFKIVNSANEDFLVTSTGVQYKALK